MPGGGLPGNWEHAVDCVIASAGSAPPGRLAIADIVADHRREPAAMAPRRAARAFSHLPGCSVFLAADTSGGYLAFWRDGRCVRVRGVSGRVRVPAAAAETCAMLLYAWACARQLPSTVTVRFPLVQPCALPAGPSEPGEHVFSLRSVQPGEQCQRLL